MYASSEGSHESTHMRRLVLGIRCPPMRKVPKSHALALILQGKHMPQYKINDNNNIVACMLIEDANQLGRAPKPIGSRDYKIFSMLNSAEHDIYPAHEC